MQRAGGDEQVQPGFRSLADGLPGAVNVLRARPGQRGHGGVLHRAGDGLDALEIAGGGHGKACLDDVNVQVLQAAGDDQLFLQVHGAAGGLLAVAQGGIENLDLAHDWLVTSKCITGS